MNAADWATVAEVGGAIICALGAALALARANFSRTQIESLRGDRDDLEARVDRIEAENGRLRTENDELRKQVGILQEQVTNRAAVDALRADMAKWREDLGRDLRKIHGQMETVAEAVGAQP